MLSWRGQGQLYLDIYHRLRVVENAMLRKISMQ
jgi:hypothetical protein